MSVKDKFSRRRFLSGVGQLGAVGVPLLMGAREATAQTPPSAPRNLRLTPTSPGGGGGGNKTVLTQGDFSYLGSFRMPESVDSMDMRWGRGLTHRYVNGQLRFFSIGLNPSDVYEVAAPASVASSPASSPFASLVRRWGAVDQGAPTSGLTGVYWDEIDKRLYWAGGDAYNATSNYAPSVGYTTLNDSNGTFTRRGPFAFSGRSTKMTNCGLTAIPQWFADAYCQGRRIAAGFGGYQSVATIGPASIGPAASAFNPADMTSAANDSAIATTVLLGYPFHQNGAYNDPQRVRRDTNYTNEFDGWNPRNGVGYWSWTDGQNQPAVWIDTATKSGLVFFPIISQGRTWYEMSSLHAERAGHAWYIYDPADLAAVAQGQVQQWQVQPKSYWSVSYPGLTYPLAAQDGVLETVTGASFDSQTSTLYLSVRLGISGAPGPNVIHVYKVL